MEYLVCMLAGVIIAVVGRKIYMKYKQHKRRRREQRRRLNRLRVLSECQTAECQTPLSVCNQYAADIKKKKQNIICKGLYAEELAEMLGGVAK